MKKNILLLLLFAALAAPGAVHAGSKSWNYLGPSAAAPGQIAPAPAPGSEADKLDLAGLLAWQDKRTSQECDSAKAHTNAAFEEVFAGLSPFSSPLPSKAQKVLKKVKRDTDRAVDAIKAHYARPRPFARDAGLKPCIDPSKGNIGPLAYPSGHATIARVYALLLADLRPANRQQYLARADEAALNRVLSGVHHPSDVEAGKRLADSLYAQFGRSRAFKRDLAALGRLLDAAPAAAGK
jgi:acid phosphatase (class A)